MSALTYFDFIIISITGISAVFAFMRGFTREILSIIGWLVAIFGTLNLPQPVREIACDYIDNTLIASGLTMLASFLLILIVFSFISHRLANQLKRTSIGGLDHLLGMAFGAVRGILIASILYFGLSYIWSPDEQADWITGSKLLPTLQEVTVFMQENISIDGTQLQNEFTPRDFCKELSFPEGKETGYTIFSEHPFIKGG
ncbi:MAG: CvpA family protein [Parvibaculales bacterium]